MLSRIVYILTSLMALTGNGFFSPPCLAQSLSAGQAKYQLGDMQGAETALTKALGTAKSKAEKSKVALLLGVVQHTKGDLSRATANFRLALALDPAVVIAPSQVLDPSVIDFFNKVKGEAKPSPHGPQSSQAKAATSPIAPNAKANKKTLLKIISTTPNAQVTIEGILAGSVNELINTEPGKTQVEISAQGYQSIRTFVQVLQNQENIISINLEKIQPKTKPTAAATSAGVAAAAVIAPAGKKVTKGAGKSRTLKPRQKPGGSGSDDLFASSEKSSSKKHPERDLTEEFEMEAKSGGAPVYPAPAYPPGYQQQPVYPYPPPQPYYPPQQPIYSPPPYQPQPGPMYGSSPSKPLSPATLLPLGIGQMSQKRYLMGALFLTTEVAAGFMYYQIGKQNTSFATTTNEYLKNFCSPGPGEELIPQAAADCATYQSESQTYLKKRKAEQQTYLLGGIAIAVAGIIESVVWDGSEPAAKPPKSAPKKRPKPPKKYRGFSLNVKPALGGGLTPPRLVETRADWTWQF